MNKCIARITLSLLFVLFVAGKAKAVTSSDVMDVCGARPEFKLNASALDEAAIKRWPQDEEKRVWWWIVLCMESGFNPNVAPSSAGAIGIGQIMPEYAAEFAKQCNLPAPTPLELKKLEVNIAISSCRLSYLFELFSGDAALALAAYNAGVNSRAIKFIRQNKTRSINRQTLGYLAFAFSLRQKLDNLFPSR